MPKQTCETNIEGREGKGRNDKVYVVFSGTVSTNYYRDCRSPLLFVVCLSGLKFENNILSIVYLKNAK